MQFDQLKRREFITLLGGGAAMGSFGARAQQPGQVRRVGVLMAGIDDADGQARATAFRQGLLDLGWQEGRNVLIDSRWGGGGNDSIRFAASEIVRLKPDLLFVNGNRGLTALQQETSTIPIVFAGLADPVEHGFVASLARPGGNITGFANFELSLISKLLALIKELAPGLTRVAVVMTSGNPSFALRTRIFLSAASELGLQPAVLPVDGAVEIEHAIAAFAREPDGGLILPGDAGIVVHRDLIIALAGRFRLPAIYPFRVMATSGGLMSYGADVVDLSRRAASYADRILKGEKPSELPVQLATKFELIINLKTAKALGLAVPNSMQLLADEVIE
jgi:putative tryptophan/tyrosine transport system substrate-binding protein